MSAPTAAALQLAPSHSSISHISDEDVPQSDTVIAIPRATLVQGLRIIFQDLNPAIYPMIRFIPNELIELVTDYAVVEPSLSVTFIRFEADRSSPESDCYASTSRGEDEIRVKCLELLMDEVTQSNNLRPIQQRAAQVYDDLIRGSESIGKVLQDDAKQLSSELIFPSKEQQSAYLLYSAYQRHLIEDSKLIEDSEFLEDDEGDIFRFRFLGLYSSILFGTIYQAIGGIHQLYEGKENDDYNSYGFVTVITELNPISGQIETSQGDDYEWNELELVNKLPNPFTPNLAMPDFFKKSIPAKKRNPARCCKEESDDDEIDDHPDYSNEEEFDDHPEDE